MYKTASTKRCFHSHAPLIIGGKEVFGGSCSTPIVHDADIYVGLDMGHRENKQAYPWEKGESFLFYIPDMGVPSSVDDFKNMVDWLATQIIADKKVHIGCIGGHGRTGTLMSALVAVMDGNMDAISYVRKNYCEKAVESSKQIDFLHTNFGITKVAPSKNDVWSSHSETKWEPTRQSTKKSKVVSIKKDTQSKAEMGNQTVKPNSSSALCLWDLRVIQLDKLS